MKMNVTATVSHALGHWPRILPALGIQVLKNRHQPCPVCGGSDRFRFDDREGRGTWYCNQCGAGDGLKLVEKVFGVSPSDAAAKVAAVTGSLPPADWNDAFTQYGGEATRKAIYDAIRPPAESPFDTMSEAEFSAMSTSEKAMRIYEHYGEALAVDANGQLLSRYENGVWKVLPPQDFARDVAGLFQRLRAPFSSGKVASVVDTLKLIIPQQEAPSRRLIGFRNGVLDTQNGTFHPHSPSHWMRTLCDVDFTPPVEGETLETHAPAFWRWLDRAAGGRAEKRDVILAALFMVLANRYDWQLFLEVTGPGGSGKSIMAEIATLLAGEDNATSATIETLESPRERAALTGFSLIRLPDQEKWSGDGAGLKAITGGDAVSVDPKYRDAYSTHIPAVILAVNNNPMRFTDRSGGVSRRRVIIHFPEQIAPQERDPQLKDKITRELAVIVRHLMQKFSDPMLARSLLQSQQNSDEALNIKRDADPTFDFIGYLETLPQTSGMYMGNASIIPRNYRKYLYHAYLAYMEANGYRNVLSLKMFGLGLPVMLKEYGLNYEKRHTKQGIQTNLTLKEESYGDWLPKCDDPATT
ncbi:TPA: phage/plasmid primase, P4 family [Escherichia coli]